MHNLDNIVELLLEINPDFICLQEVDFFSWRTDFVNQATYIANALAKKSNGKRSYNVEFESSFNLDEKKYKRLWKIGRYFYGRDRAKWVFKNLGIPHVKIPNEPVKLHFGNATLSKFPIKKKEHYFFRPPYWEPWMNFNIIRRADERKSRLVCRVNYYEEIAEKIPLFIYNTHLENTEGYHRRNQSEILSSALDKRQNAHIVLAGDLNAEPGDEAIEKLLRHPKMKFYPDYYPQTKTDKYSTFPSDSPDETLDTVLISEFLEYVSYQVHPRRVSDHLAVVTEIKINQDLVPKNKLKQMIDYWAKKE